MTTEDKGYNGWTNWETWNANLWVMNEEPLYRLWQANKPYKTVHDVQLLVLQAFPRGTPDMRHDPTAIFRINWEELLQSWNED